MVTRDPQKEFQLNPLTAIVPFHDDFATLSKNLAEVEARYQELEILLKDPTELTSYSEQSIKRMQCELDMHQVILIWAGRIKPS